jgi:hypothetical protein
MTTTDEIMRLAAIYRMSSGPIHTVMTEGALRVAVSALVAERDALQTDAERYRWIRTAGAWESELTLDALSDDPEKFDAAVDASKEGKP